MIPQEKEVRRMISIKKENMEKMIMKPIKEKYFYVHEWDEADWTALIDLYEKNLEEAEEFGKAFLRVN